MEQNILSKRKKEKFHEGGYIYVFDRYSSDGGTKFWRCERKNECPARIHTIDGTVNKRLNQHVYDSSAAKVEADIVVTAIKRRAETTMEATSVVITECSQDISAAASTCLPSNLALKKTVRRQRNEIIRAPTCPPNLESLIIPEDLTLFHQTGSAPEQFLIADSGPGNERILIFGLERSIRMLKESKVWYADGTFRLAPTLFAQIYVILCEMNGGVHPAIYALLPNKSRNIYSTLFGMLKQREPNLAPEIINCDFEIAAFIPMQTNFPGVSINGCFFHFGQNLRKHLAELDLIGRYNSDAEFALNCKKISAVAFVPEDNIDYALDCLDEILPAELKPALDWLEDNYVGRRNRRGPGRRPAIFPVKMWNVYNRVLNSQDRTNNHAEAAHRRLQAQLQMDHPTIWKLIDGLKKVQKERNIFYERLVAGNRAVPKLKKYRDTDARLMNLVQNFANKTMSEYLRGIAHNTELTP